jgi:signal transduction histidine kinase
MLIRSRLLVLVSAVLVPALLVSAIGVAYLYSEEQKFNRATAIETARALARAIERDLARRESILRTLSAAPTLHDGDLSSFYAFALAVANANGAAIILSDLEGRQILNTRLPFGSALPPMLPIEREARARLGDEVTIVSDLYLPPAGLGSHSFAVQYPVRREGKVVHFLTLASFAAEIQNLLIAQRLPAEWNASITDRRGIIVARGADAEKFVGKPVRKDLLARMSAQDEGFHVGTTLGGVPATAFFSRVPAAGWSLLIGVPHTALYAPAGRATVVMAGLSLLVLALGLAAAMLVARRISRPVESLRQAAQALGSEGAVRPPPTGTVELDAVGEAMARASERLHGTQSELERRVAEALASFEQSQRALLQAQKLEALGRLTGGIAHDFNNVLQTLTAGLDTLRHGAGEQQRALLGRCQRAVVRGTELARQLMAFGRVQELRAQTIDTGARLGEAQQLFGGALPANIRLDYDLEPELWPVRADPSQLELALLNLVINARDAMPHGGTLELRGRNQAVSGRGELAAGDYVALSVSDTGEGMSEEVKARAFDPFYTTKGVGKGSGMGLPQAYGFARQNGGTLVLESRAGQGTTATLYLPRASEAVAHDAAPPAAQARVAGKGRVLFVEDDDEVRETVAAALRAAGYEIYSAVTADEALARLNVGERYDAVFTDVVMPGVLSGVDLAVEVRRRFPGIGVVVATGYSDRAVQIEGVRALPKPYDRQQAVEALNAAMAGKSN